MKLRAHQHAVAWLGLIAMWLVVFAPLVSQLLVASRADEPVSAICSAVDSGAPAAHHAFPDKIAACGYCDFLAHHVAAPGVPPAGLVATLSLADAQVSAPPPFVPHAAAFPSGRPRAPPVLS
ncbi:DUF2946 domain-containing protein [Paraburkholderia caffeinilytica]|uniref:DUF2946 domain-containing protein n=1 Tax=Paraburkholderia caffeinilytica TaxID=1761016 RepID=UPI000E20E11B|nr:DUF2946 domain-containing protein [Paraburkholderia caffeinilytica]